MDAVTPRGLADGLCTENEAAGARALDPGLSIAREAAKDSPSRKRPQ